MLFFKPKKGIKEEIKKHAPQNPKILEVNLIKGEVKIVFDWAKNISILVVTLLVVAAFVTEIYLGLSWWGEQEKVRAESLNLSISKLKAEISKVDARANEALAYKNKSIEVGRLLDNHIYWSKFFAWIEKNTLSTVKFSGFSGDTKGTYTLSATALSFSEASWQVKAFLNDPMVKKVSVASVSAGEASDKTAKGPKGVSFTLNLELNPDIFKK
ncbi:MAG: hypothetical protein ACOYL8_00905 [Patescibacteria group bacterium]